MEVEPVESDKNLRGLRRLDDEVESHIRSLSALGVVSDSYGAMLAPVLLKKLPPDVRLTISRKTASSNPNVDQVLKIMGEELIARERSSHHAATPRHHEKHSAALFASSSHSHTPNCCYCHQPIRQLTVTQSSLLMHASKHFVAVEGVSIVWGEVTSAGPVAPLPDAPIVEASTIPVYVHAANHQEVLSNLLRQHHHSIRLLVHLHRLRTTFVQAASRPHVANSLCKDIQPFPAAAPT